MVISDLNYLETATSSSEVKGGILNFASFQANISLIGQSSNANAGNVALFSLGNTALSGNNATVTQVNA
ncbi:hypothetical protein ACN4EK_21565 [Pantanalinema rosaneae CENA516]|uniref:hypothetical protein n=1 Tax=Pantanalinema rosaneae TaxID=1620701 RepID=UPI003D6EEA1F